ncbi:unnamed protein product [Mytilus edulis]|uniref:Death domain-containing protein n=1 Tax=Mytilus edulis TaxID=6550 RepID=A0A8S3RZX4_MYTED|nr:unnamed protein product [Mytilus edulis]
MPIAWVPLELQISEMRTKGINLVTKETIQEFNLANPEFMLNEFRLDEFLKLNILFGKIMYFDQPALHDFVIVQPSAMIFLLNQNEDNQGSQNETYLVPCLVKSTIPCEFLKFEEEKTICLAYQLTEEMIPSSLTFKLIGAAIATWPLKKSKGRVCLYYQSAIMHVDDSNELLLIIKGQRVEIYLSNQSSKHLISPDVAASIQECLTLVLQRVLLFYHECFGRSTSKLDVLNLFEIEVGEICKGELCVVPLFRAEKKKPWTCEKNKKHETRYCLEAKALSLDPNDQHLVRLAKQIGINLFDQFLLYLGLTRDEWEEIEYQYRQNGLLGMKLMALYEWKKKNETVKLQALLDALNGIERPHYLCQVRKLPLVLF